MAIYWTFFFAPLGIRVVQSSLDSRYGLKRRKSTRRQDFALIVVAFTIVIFFIGMRGGMADTSAYISSYKRLPSDIRDFEWDPKGKDEMFDYLSCLFKSVTKASYQPWLFTIALISGVAIARGIYKYSDFAWLSCYLFVASADFTYMLNGMRQFIPVSILFCNMGLLTEKKYVRFILLVAIVAQIHASAWAVLLAIPLSRFKPWSPWMVLVIAAGAIVALNFESFVGVMDTMLEDTQYAGKAQDIAEGTGSNIMRLFISAVPVIIAFIARKKIERKNDSRLDLLVNLSVMAMVIMLISTFTYGILVGRLATYFSIFNLLLLPWLVMNAFDKKTNRLLTMGMVVLYGIYFYYQMCVAWHMYYVSEALGLFIR